MFVRSKKQYFEVGVQRGCGGLANCLIVREVGGERSIYRFKSILKTELHEIITRSFQLAGCVQIADTFDGNFLQH